MMRAVSLPTQARAAVDLSQALCKLVPLERQAFNIDGKETTANKPPAIELDRLTDEQLEQVDRFASITSKSA